MPVHFPKERTRLFRLLSAHNIKRQISPTNLGFQVLEIRWKILLREAVVVVQQTALARQEAEGLLRAAPDVTLLRNTHRRCV